MVQQTSTCIYQTHAMFCRHPVKSNIKHITPSYTNIAKVIRYGQQLMF